MTPSSRPEVGRAEFADGHAVALRDRLRAAGLRATKPRVAVLTWLAGHPHSTADQAVSAVRPELGGVSTQAVYDVLRACTAAGLLRRIEPAGHPARFEARTADNHHHLVCRHCGRTEDIDCAHGTAPCLSPAHSAGYAVDEAEVVFWGVCPDCRTAAPSGDQLADPNRGARSGNAPGR
ncbi:Fur family transcriptional regulator [Saccharopolyspora gloriosae]|uniref:Fur family transcriptional regulator n=1 Tax=Saccharopolyspora gloriosae TaxID=455344 RepID=UPI001FB7343A|nr:Fur family transcriptional regulator [Saccharopolyspora gloriosae]